MVQLHYVKFSDHKQPWFWVGSGWNLPNFCLAAMPQGHGMSKIRHTKPFQHCNITHWTHMKVMEWFSRAMLGVLATNNLDFGLALGEICQTYGQWQCQGNMACQKSDTQSLFNIVTSLIGPIWMMWNGSHKRWWDGLLEMIESPIGDARRFKFKYLSRFRLFFKIFCQRPRTCFTSSFWPLRILHGES